MPNLVHAATGALFVMMSACGQSQGSSVLARESGSASNNPLVGQWERCEAFDEIEGAFGIKFPYAAFSTRLGFTDQAKGYMEITFSKDRACQTPLSQADIDTYINAVEQACKEQYPDIDCSGIADSGHLGTKKQLLFSYQAGDPTAEGFGTIDVTSAMSDEQPDVLETQYMSYKVSAAGLQLAEVCFEEDVKDGLCSEVKGDRLDNRATAITSKLYLRR